MPTEQVYHFSKSYLADNPGAQNFHPTTFGYVLGVIMLIFFVVAIVAGFRIGWMMLFQSPFKTGMKEFQRQHRKTLAK